MTSFVQKIKNFFRSTEETKGKKTKKKKVQKKQKKILSTEERKAKEERANKLLKEQLAQEKAQQEQKKQEKRNRSQEVKKSQKATEKKSIERKKLSRKQRSSISGKEQEAENFATQENTVLFIQASTKRLKVIEWKQTKKRIILNKEREIRRTHKGGWSQEKFQRFVDNQITKTPEWIETNLAKQGILRGPYDEVIVETDQEELETKIQQIIKRLLG